MLCTAKEKRWYNGREREVGEAFEVEERDVAVLSAIGMIDTPRKQEYATRDMTAQLRRQKASRH